jgi:hypothetical protein
MMMYEDILDLEPGDLLWEVNDRGTTAVILAGVLMMPDQRRAVVITLIDPARGSAPLITSCQPDGQVDWLHRDPR